MLVTCIAASPAKKMVIVTLCMVICQFGWAGFGVLVKATTGGSSPLDPLVLSVLREGCSTVLLGILGLVVEGPQEVTWKNVPVLFAGGAIGFALTQSLYVYGIYFSSASIAGIMQPLVPVVTCLLSLLLGVEVFYWRQFVGWLKIFGIFLSVGGTLWLVLADLQVKTEGTMAWGILMFVFQVICSAIYIIIQKKYIFITDEHGNPRHLFGPITATALMNWFAALILGVVVLIRSFFDAYQFAGINNIEIVLPVAYAVFVASSLCYSLVSFCNTLTTPVLITAFWPLQTFAGILLSYFVLGERLSWVTGVSGTLIILGLFLVCVGKYKEMQFSPTKE